MHSMAATASTAPAAEIRCPIIDLVALTGTWCERSPQQGFDRSGFRYVVFRCPGAMRVDGVDIAGGDRRVVEAPSSWPGKLRDPSAGAH